MKLEFIERDCGDYIELIPNGVLVHTDDIFIIAGDTTGFPQAQAQGEGEGGRNGRVNFTVPQIVFKLPKELPQNVPTDTFLKQVYEEGIDKFMVSFEEGFHKCKSDQESAAARGGGGTDMLGMKELQSSLHNCFMGHCVACSKL